MVDKPGAVVITLNLSLYYDDMISKCYYWNIGDAINPILIRISEQGGNGKPNEDQGPNEGDDPGEKKGTIIALKITDTISKTNASQQHQAHTRE